jgi:hypothetical protein
MGRPTAELLGPAAGEWLHEAAKEVADRPESLLRYFAAAARKAGRHELPGTGWRSDEAARALLLAAVPPDRRAGLTSAVYEHGSTAEKHAVLRALPFLDLGGRAEPILLDAVRTNEPSLVAAALGPPARHLSQEMWRQAVLKCVFMGIDLAAVDALDERADDELARMLGALADERAAAGRTIPADATALLSRLGRTEED